MTASVLTVPQPATRVAFLISSGYGRVKATRHKYVETREAEFVTSNGEPTTPIWEFMFQCEETGEIRRWGYEYRMQVAN